MGMVSVFLEEAKESNSYRARGTEDIYEASLINHTRSALSNKTQTRLNPQSCLQVISAAAGTRK